MEPPLTVTSGERSPPVNGHFYSPRAIFLYITPLLSGHLSSPASGHQSDRFGTKFPTLNGQNPPKIGKIFTEMRSRKYVTFKSDVDIERLNLRSGKKEIFY